MPLHHIIPRHATGSQGGGNVAWPYCAERRRSGVATLVGGESGRSLLGARAFPRRHTAQSHRVRTTRRRERVIIELIISPSSGLHLCRLDCISVIWTASLSFDPESHVSTLRDQAREFERAGGVSF